MTDQAYTVEQFIAVFKVGRTKLFEEIGSGRLMTYRLGKRRYVSAAAAAAWQARLEAEANQQKESAPEVA